MLGAACAGPEGAQTGGAPTPTGQPVKLRYMGRGTIANQELQKAGLAEFQKRQPKITVEMEAPAQFLPALLAQIAGGDAVDVAYTAIGNFRGLAKQGGLVALDPFVARDVKRATTTSTRSVGQAQRDVLRLPLRRRHVGPGLQQGAVDQAQLKYPDDTWTWDTYMTNAARLTVDQGGRRSGESGFDPAQIAQYGSAPALREHWWYWVWSNGGEVLSADRKRAVIDSASALETIQWIADLGTRRVVMPTPAYPEADPAVVDGDAGFSAGRVAMAPHGRWRVPEIRRLAKFGWDVAPMPKGKQGGWATAGTRGCRSSTAPGTRRRRGRWRGSSAPRRGSMTWWRAA